jgi:hypothetical protein
MVSLTQYLRDVAARGGRIIEHPDYGGVTPGIHMKKSMHWLGRAGDINFGPPGIPDGEREFLLWAARLADAAGLNVIYTPHRVHPIPKTAANHRDHLHVDDGPIAAYRAPGADDDVYRRILAERPVTTAPTEEDDDDMANWTPEDSRNLADLATYARRIADAVTDGQEGVKHDGDVIKQLKAANASLDTVERSLTNGQAGVRHDGDAIKAIKGNL